MEKEKLPTRANIIASPDRYMEYKGTALHAEILHNASFNKSTAFTSYERDTFGLRGLLPPVVETLETQVSRCLAHLRSFEVPLNKYIYLDSLRERNQTVFYRLLVENFEEVTPLIYTPTIGEACQKWGKIFRTATGMYFAPNDKGYMRKMLDNWPSKEVDIIVVTDGSRILGLGDLGVNGMGIPVGKLSLYVAAAGFHPLKTLPCMLDTGTNNEQFLSDPLYFGTRTKRLPDEEYYVLVDEFLSAVKDKWPHCLVQFEDFSNDHCFDLLEKYRQKMLCFNDDIQGTGAVIASGFINAIKMSGKSYQDQQFVFLGAGGAGIGVADMIASTMVQEDPSFTIEEARKRFWFVDSKGLVTTKRNGKIEAHKIPYARTEEEPISNLADVVKLVKPTALIGLAGIEGGVFTPEIISDMGKFNERPIIFALSNPTSKSECTAQDAYKYTEGRAIFASGSPFDPVEYDGKMFYPGQGNNALIFPAIGFGSIMCKAEKITDGMLSAAARGLALQVKESEKEEGRIYPKLDRIREISAVVASKVIEQAFEEGVARIERPTDILAMIKEAMYFPEYHVSDKS